MRKYKLIACFKNIFLFAAGGPTIHPDAGEIIFNGGDPETSENSSMTWCYHAPRVITNIHLTPVPFSLSSSAFSADSSSSGTMKVSRIIGTVSQPCVCWPLE